MNPGEVIIILFIMFVLAVAGTRWQQWRDEAELSYDFRVASDVALRYANLKCSSPPQGAVTLDSAAADLGLVVRVEHPQRWRILLTPRPGLTGPATALRYLIAADTWQWVYLLDTYPAVARANHIDLHIKRRPASPNRLGFQGLLENTLC